MEKAAEEFCDEPRTFARVADILVTRVMDCPDCRARGISEMRARPPRDDPKRWVRELHNRVNLELGKPYHHIEKKEGKPRKFVLGGYYL